MTMAKPGKVGWVCPPGVYLGIGAERTVFIKDGIQHPFKVQPNTRARAILETLLVHKFAEPSVLKREVEQRVDKPIADPPSNTVAKENRQVFQPRLAQYLPDIPRDVIVYHRPTKRYLSRVPLVALPERTDPAFTRPPARRT